MHSDRFFKFRLVNEIGRRRHSGSQTQGAQEPTGCRRMGPMLLWFGFIGNSPTMLQDFPSLYRIVQCHTIAHLPKPEVPTPM